MRQHSRSVFSALLFKTIVHILINPVILDVSFETKRPCKLCKKPPNCVNEPFPPLPQAAKRAKRSLAESFNGIIRRKVSVDSPDEPHVPHIQVEKPTPAKVGRPTVSFVSPAFDTQLHSLNVFFDHTCVKHKIQLTDGLTSFDAALLCLLTPYDYLCTELFVCFPSQWVRKLWKLNSAPTRLCALCLPTTAKHSSPRPHDAFRSLTRCRCPTQRGGWPGRTLRTALPPRTSGTSTGARCSR